MLDKNATKNVLVIDDKSAIDLGLFDDGIEHVRINGKPVELKVVDTYSWSWNLPNVVIKAHAYLEALEKGNGHQELINVYSNAVANFDNVIEFDYIKNEATDLCFSNLEFNDYKINDFVNQFNYKKISQTLESLDSYKDFYKVATNSFNNYKDETEQLVKKLESYDSELIDFEDKIIDDKISLIASYQKLFIDSHQAMLDVNSLNNKQMADNFAKLLLNIKTQLEILGYQFDDIPITQSKSISIETTDEGSIANNETKTSLNESSLDSVEENLIVNENVEFKTTEQFDFGNDSNNDVQKNWNEFANVKNEPYDFSFDHPVESDVNVNWGEFETYKNPIIDDEFSDSNKFIEPSSVEQLDLGNEPNNDVQTDWGEFNTQTDKNNECVNCIDSINLHAETINNENEFVQAFDNQIDKVPYIKPAEGRVEINDTFVFEGNEPKPFKYYFDLQRAIKEEKMLQVERLQKIYQKNLFVLKEITNLLQSKANDSLKSDGVDVYINNKLAHLFNETKVEGEVNKLSNERFLELDQELNEAFEKIKNMVNENEQVNKTVENIVYLASLNKKVNK